MRITFILFAGVAALALAPRPAEASLLSNGNLDRVHNVEIVPGFFLPKPDVWENVGIRTISGPYEDEMSSEPWAGPAPTPVTADGLNNPPGEGHLDPDWGVFFKAFTGNGTTGDFANGHLYQDVPGTPGHSYTLTGWAGAEPNFLGGAVFAIDFLDGGGGVIGSSQLDLIGAGLFVDNGLPFDYKQYSIGGVAPPGTVTVRARASMLNAAANPQGGGQAYVVDDFVLTPEPTTALGMALMAVAAFARRR
jgi:hypothetical protein